ncbi:MAG: ATP-binding protein, partial [Saprospiraceae bacterium]
MSQHIARFNPYSMDDETVLAVATGRKQPLSVVLETLADNLSGNEQQHLMVVGPRGRGKSFFLKYLRIMFERDERFQHCLFISLPEEQSNVRFASDLVRMILSQINGEGFRSVTPLWREPEELWQNSVNELEAYCRQQAAEHEGKFLLVAVVENFQDLLERLDETGEHRIRHLMEHLPQFTLIGATPYARVDSDYNRPIFHIFKEIQIQPWPEESYLKYFRRRQQLESERTGKTWTEAELRFKEAKLRAISQYTGG